MRVPPSTARLRNKITDTDTGIHITTVEKKANKIRQVSLNVITGDGCVTCCGRVYGESVDGSRIACPVLADPKVRIVGVSEQEELDIRKAAKGCAIPELYRAVHDRERTEPVTPEEVRSLCPFLDNAELSIKVVEDEPPMAEQASKSPAED